MSPTAIDADRDAAVTLREITAATVRQVCALRVAPSQEHFVAPNAVSLAEALFSPAAWFRAVYVGETPAGFVMLQESDPATPFLWRLMIAAEHQGKGYGRRAIALLLDHVVARPGATALHTRCVPGKGSPCAFYRALGFAETGAVDGAEVVLRLALPGPAERRPARGRDGSEPGGAAGVDGQGEAALARPGVHPAPNTQTAPDVCETENRAIDPDRRIEAADDGSRPDFSAWGQLEIRARLAFKDGSTNDLSTYLAF